MVRDADTTIYLFGTFHTLDGQSQWMSPKLETAFDASGELVLETIVPKTRAEMDAAADKNTSGDKSYFKSTAAVMKQGRAQGLSTEMGADQVLRRLAEAQGKPVAGLEDFGAQLAALSKIKAMPAPAAAVAAPAPAQTVTLDQLLSAWKAGDSGAFALMLAGFKSRAPEAYRILIADRNKAWAGWIAKRLDQPGTVFVAVGSGHLAGSDSVQAKLAAKGIAARRIG